MKMKRFTLCFRERNFTDWHMILHTTEDYTPEEIMDIIEKEKERVLDEEETYNEDSYCTLNPVRIIDNLVDSHPGWDWEDFYFDVDVEWNIGGYGI